jgi:hypothetical protein
VEDGHFDRSAVRSPRDHEDLKRSARHVRSLPVLEHAQVKRPKS